MDKFYAKCDHTELKKIGEGAFGSVFEIEEPDGKIKALKSISFTPNHYLSEQYITAYREVIIGRLFKHPNIAHNSVIILANDNLSLVTDKAEKDLFKLIHTFSRVKYDKKKATLDICEGINFLHQNNVIHRDIKPANILVSENKYTITDFGAAAKLQRNLAGSESSVTSDLNMTTWIYAAPEIILNYEDSNMFTYNKATDAWALGATLYELFSGKSLFKVDYNTYEGMLMIFKDCKQRHLEDRIKRDITSNDLSQIILGLLDLDKEKRLTLTDALKSKFFERAEIKSHVLNPCVIKMGSFTKDCLIPDLITQSIFYCYAYGSGEIVKSAEWLFLLADIIYRTHSLLKIKSTKEYCLACSHITMIYYGLSISETLDPLQEKVYSSVEKTDPHLVCRYINLILEQTKLALHRNYLFELCENETQVQVVIDNIVMRPDNYFKVDLFKLKEMLSTYKGSQSAKAFATQIIEYVGYFS